MARKIRKRAARRRIKRKARKPRFISPVTRALERAGIKYKILPHRRTVYTAAEIAAERKRPARQIVKCIVLSDNLGNIVLACLPGDKRLRVGLVRDIMGTGKLEFVPEKQLRALTGQPLGTTAPIALKTAMPIVIDRSLAREPKVSISSGNLKFGIELKTADLLRLTGARIAKISE
jgi:Cys-tRNA(Pro)/Cys-tRNA(Cys) deacylase